MLMDLLSDVFGDPGLPAWNQLLVCLHMYHHDLQTQAVAVHMHYSSAVLPFTSMMSILHWLTQHIGLAVRKWSSPLPDRTERLMGPRYLLTLSKQTRWLGLQTPPCPGISSFTSILLRGNTLNQFTPKLQ